MSLSSPNVTSGDKLPSFLAAANLKPFFPNEVPASTKMIPFGPRVPAMGYQAELLVLTCEIFSKHAKQRLRASQKHIARRCDTSCGGLRGWDSMPCIDEATGYQAVRPCVSLSA